MNQSSGLRATTNDLLEQAAAVMDRARMLQAGAVPSDPFQVLLHAEATGLDHDCKAQAEQVRSVAVERIGRQVGTVPPDLMVELDHALRLHLAL